MVKFQINIDPELLEEVRIMAKQEKRTVTGQINYYIQNGLWNHQIMEEDKRQVIAETKGAKNERMQ